MVLTIKNFESQNVWPWVVETAPTNLVWVAGTLKATLTWTSATGESWVTWTEEKLVRKEGSAPAWSLDWDVVVTITTKDVYASTWYEDTGLDSTKTYYYKVFAIYDNWTEKGSSEVNVTPDWPLYPIESIVYRMQTDGSGKLHVPISWRNRSQNAGASYDWNVSVDWWTPTRYSGRWYNGSVFALQWTYSQWVHTIEITPNDPVYGWALAYWWANTQQYYHAERLMEVLYDWSYMWYAVSATDTWNYFRAWQYIWCKNLLAAPAEYLPEGVTNIWNSFRNQQFLDCSSLLSAPAESLPDTVVSIGESFRSSQYAQCVALSSIQWWKDLNIWGMYYRSTQYNHCTAEKTIKVLGNVWYSMSWATWTAVHGVANEYVTRVDVPAIYLNNFLASDAPLPRSQIDNNKFYSY